jgi:hypothetical protein
LLRSRRSGLKKVGLLALALVMALGSLGVAYAAWTDQVYVVGTVNTGTLDIDICGVSSTFVYKVPGTPDTGYGPETVVDYYYSTEGDYTPPGGEAMLVAQAITEDTSVWKEEGEIVDTDSATMSFQGVFPGIDFLTDIELEYLGSVPAKVYLAEITPLSIEDPDYDADDAAILQELLDLGESSGHTEGIWLDAELSTDDGSTWVTIPDAAEELELLGLQLEQNYLLHITMHVLLPQDPAYEHLTLDFSGQITVVQWNEYEEPEA